MPEEVGLGAGNRIPEDQIRDALDMFLRSDGVRQAANIRDFVRYVVEQEIAGQGDKLKAYTIAVDALGRPDTFDPGRDPAVRVLANRVRKALDLFWHRDGRDLPVRIVLPVGGYRPVFLPNDTPATDLRIPDRTGDDKAASAPARRPDRSSSLLAIAVSVFAVLAMLLIGGMVWMSFRPAPPQTAGPVVPPIIDILPFQPAGDDVLATLAEGMRQQIALDLSRFDTLRVRLLPADGDVTRPPDAAVKYRATGQLAAAGDNFQLFLAVSDSATGTLIWSETLPLAANDAGFQTAMLTAIRGIVTRLAATNGVINTQAIAALEARSAALSNPDTAEYDCVLRFYAFDQSKDEDLRDRARDCLTQLTASGSRNSAVWASFAMMTFLDWTRSGEPPQAPVLDDAIAAAQKALLLDPANANAQEYLGSIVLARGEFQRALDHYQRALELNPSKPDLFVVLGWQQCLLGDWAQGLMRIRQGIDLSPQPPGWMRLPLAIGAYRDGDYAEALSQARNMVDLGDARGMPLALAAALALGDATTIETWTARLRADSRIDLFDPMNEVRAVFNSPADLRRMEEALSLHLTRQVQPPALTPLAPATAPIR